MNEFVASPGPVAGRFNPDSAEASWTLPAEWYFDPAIFAREREAIFYRTWVYQCAANELPEPGDYYCGSVADQEIFIVRGGDGILRAFYNVCSHRAHPLLEGQGNARLIVCPYHQWCYQADGCFRGARGKDALKDWSPENADLKPVRLEEYAGLLFVNLDADAEPLAPQGRQAFGLHYGGVPRGRQSDARHAARTPGCRQLEGGHRQQSRVLPLCGQSPIADGGGRLRPPGGVVG
ncbi:MAG: Rieske (2Fe-2S) protein [Hyphomicrobiales bacterium]|nr:Rieske (2Fe-2S) protein [Hyphomicrobiales bacterium]